MGAIFFSCGPSKSIIIYTTWPNLSSFYFSQEQNVVILFGSIHRVIFDCYVQQVQQYRCFLFNFYFLTSTRVHKCSCRLPTGHRYCISLYCNKNINCHYGWKREPMISIYNKTAILKMAMIYVTKNKSTAIHRTDIGILTSNNKDR